MVERILLVDDEPMVLAGLQRTLRHRFDLRCAQGGAEALALIDSDGPFAVVVSDMRMPGMNGVELLREIRRRSPQTIRLILSGHSDFQDLVGAVNDGAVFRFLTKPASTEILLESLELAVLNHRHQHRHGPAPGPDLAREAAALRLALSQGQLRLFVQPQAQLVDGRVCGAEALIRWQHPQHGLLVPGRFLPMADAAGLAPAMTDWVLDTACAQLRRWLDQKLPLTRLAVNISAEDVADPAFLDRLSAPMRRHRVPPQHLELELTEGVAVDDLERASHVLGQVAALGMGVSIDDFGTGYASMGWLRRLPIGKLKVDRMFVDDVADDPEAYRFLASLLSMARDLGLTTLAEGIETLEQLKQASRAGCDLIQGFLLAAPMPAEDFSVWLAGRTSAVGATLTGAGKQGHG